jgi:DNA-binding CsgD family transcriptional regulator
MPLRLFAERRRTGAYITRALYLGAMIGFFYFTTQLVEHEGRSHLPSIGDAESVVTQVRRFLGLPRLRTALPTGLTARQTEVAALVADGLTNRQLAERLGITERSAESHVERIRLRLGFSSRSQVAAWYVATGSHK